MKGMMPEEKGRSGWVGALPEGQLASKLVGRSPFERTHEKVEFGNVCFGCGRGLQLST